MNTVNRKKHLPFVLFLIFITVEYGFCDGSEPNGITDTPLKLVFELRNFESIRFRLSGSSIKTDFPFLSSLRIVILGITANNKSAEIEVLGFNYLDLGISGSYFKIGPVYICGLLREIGNPLGYSPWSDVRMEDSELRLNGSFPPYTFSNESRGYLNINHGISYSIFPNVTDIYAYRKGRLLNGTSPLHLGVVTRLDILPEVSINGRIFEGKAEILSALTEPFALEDYSEEWYQDNVPFPGEKLLHLGSRLSFTCSPVKDRPDLGSSEGGGKLSVYYSLIGLSGTLIKPGFLTEGFASWETDALKLGFFSGYRAEDYRDTKGKANRNMLSINASLQLLPLETGGLSLDYKGLLKYPDFMQGEFTEGEEDISSKISWLLFPCLKNRTVVSIEGEKRLSYSDDGKVLESNGLTAAFLYSRGHAEKDKKMSIGADFNIIENTFVFRYYTGGNKITVNILNPFSKFVFALNPNSFSAFVTSRHLLGCPFGFVVSHTIFPL